MENYELLSEEEIRDYYDSRAANETIEFLGITFVHSESEPWISRNDLAWLLKHMKKSLDKEAEKARGDQAKTDRIKSEKWILKYIEEEIVNKMWYFMASAWEVKGFPNKEEIEAKQSEREEET